MFEAVLWLGLILLIIGGIKLIVGENRARAEITEAEWENREREYSALGTSAFALDQILRPDLERAKAVMMDQRGGHFLQAEQAGEQLEEGAESEEDVPTGNDDEEKQTESEKEEL